MTDAGRRLSGPYQGTAGKNPGGELFFVNQCRSSNQQIMHADAGFHGFFEGGAVGDGLRIEDNDVGVGAFLQTALPVRGGSGTLQHLRGHQSHLAKRFHQGKRLFLTHILR